MTGCRTVTFSSPFIPPERRTAHGLAVLPADAVRVFWVNPPADLRVMNRLEETGGRLCGTEFLFSHAMDDLIEEEPPFEALARAAAADPMVGPTRERANRIARDARAYGAEALVVSRIPGASHYITKGAIIGETVRRATGIPWVELEVPPLSDALAPGLVTRLEALMETARARRGSES